MDPAAFAESPVGQLVAIEGYDARHASSYTHVAFVPDPLPETLDLSGPTWEAVASAMNSLGRLDQAGRQLPNPVLFRRPATRREAVSTSALEGTHAAITEVLEADVAGDARSPEVAEVLNYVRAAEHAYESVGDRGLTVGLLSELQEILVRNTPLERPDSGRIRTHQVLIGPDGCKVEEARFVPPPPGDLLDSGVREWEKWIARPRAMPSIVQAALAHYQFETLHPYHDGNGRIGRLVIVLQLMVLEELEEPLLTVSSWLESHRREYHDRLLEVSKTGVFDQWIRFFSQAVDAQARQTVDTIGQLLALEESLRARIREEPIRGVAAQIAEDLIGRPIVTPTWAAKYYGVSYPAANAAVNRLTELGILEELTGRNYARIFASRRVISLLER